MTPLADLPTAPQGNVTQAGHKHAINLRDSLPGVTPTSKSGEAGQ